MDSYHQVIQRLAPVITGYLQAAPETHGGGILRACKRNGCRRWGKRERYFHLLET